MEDDFDIETRSFDWRRYLCSCARSNSTAGMQPKEAVGRAFDIAEYLWSFWFFDRERYEAEQERKGGNR